MSIDRLSGSGQTPTVSSSPAVEALLGPETGKITDALRSEAGDMASLTDALRHAATRVGSEGLEVVAGGREPQGVPESDPTLQAVVAPLAGRSPDAVMKALQAFIDHNLYQYDLTLASTMNEMTVGIQLESADSSQAFGSTTAEYRQKVEYGEIRHYLDLKVRLNFEDASLSDNYKALRKGLRIQLTERQGNADHTKSTLDRLDRVLGYGKASLAENLGGFVQFAEQYEGAR